MRLLMSNAAEHAPRDYSRISAAEARHLLALARAIMTNLQVLTREN